MKKKIFILKLVSLLLLCVISLVLASLFSEIHQFTVAAALFFIACLFFVEIKRSYEPYEYFSFGKSLARSYVRAGKAKEFRLFLNYVIVILASLALVHLLIGAFLVLFR